jgi:hypothetical protein
MAPTAPAYKPSSQPAWPFLRGCTSYPALPVQAATLSQHKHTTLDWVVCLQQVGMTRRHVTTQHGCILSHPLWLLQHVTDTALQWYTTCISAANMKRLHKLSESSEFTSHQLALMGFAALHVAQLQSNCSSNLDASEVCIRMLPHLAVAPQLCMQACTLPEWITQPCPLRGELYAHSYPQPAKTKPCLSNVSHSKAGMQNACQGVANAEGMRLVHTWKTLHDLFLTNCFNCLLPVCPHTARHSSKQNQHPAGKVCSQLKGMGAGQLTHGMKYAESTTGVW